MADEVATELRRRVLSGDLKQGERLTQDKLAKSLGVSTMPVREALLRLAAEGLILTEANRSFSVVRNTTDDLRDIYWIYGKLSGELAARTATIITPAALDQLAALHAEHESATTGEQRFQVTWSFHRIVHKTAGSRRMLHVLSSTLRFFPDLLELPGAVELESAYQSALVENMRAHDAEAARLTTERFATGAAQIFIDRHGDPE